MQLLFYLLTSLCFKLWVFSFLPFSILSPIPPVDSEQAAEWPSRATAWQHDKHWSSDTSSYLFASVLRPAFVWRQRSIQQSYSLSMRKFKNCSGNFTFELSRNVLNFWRLVLHRHISFSRLEERAFPDHYILHIFV